MSGVMSEQRATSVNYGLIILGTAAMLALYLSSLYSYLLFHTLAEVFSIVIACGIFILAWNTRQYFDNNYLLFFGIALLPVAGLDLVHTMAYKGMNIFPGYDANLPTQLWIAARYTQSLSLLISPWFLHRKLNPNWAFAGYMVFVILLLVTIFGGVFPVCYVEGVGLTPFKKISEYLISLILLGAAALLIKNHLEFDRVTLRLLVWSIAMTIGAELAFTFYVDVYGLSNLLGHLFKIVSFVLLYKVFIEVGLAEPFRLVFGDLKRAEASLREHRDHLAELVKEQTTELVASNERLQKEIAGRKRAETELAKRAEELARTNTELEQFAYVASHDLREPLRMVSSYLQLLKQHSQDQLDETAHEFIDFAIDGAARMKRLIADLLTFSRVGTRDLEPEPTSGEQVLEQVLGDLQMLIEENKASVTHDPLPTVMADATQLAQLFQNLISNSIKFRSEQPPCIHIGARECEGGWEFSIRDNGIGIDPQFTDRIFVIFQRLHAISEYPGTGIGLAICKKIVERHGGRIWVESKVGAGATFYFTLSNYLS
jgi:signal transduction histidine kinase